MEIIQNILKFQKITFLYLIVFFFSKYAFLSLKKKKKNVLNIHNNYYVSLKFFPSY